ncbi:FAFR488Wp [Eremothecium gossypii FDAG1]|nr:FAFR488Wp [Eremothecium gossypii FDAG1]
MHRVRAATAMLFRHLATSAAPAAPLNVLFFGSDQFSAHSLRALAALQPGRIVGDIQLVTRPAKRCGRYLQATRELPVVAAARELALPPPLRCDTRDDLLALRARAPRTDLLVAVSYGQLIPAELVRSVPHSLNVHPSLLPRYRGAAPIQHTLLNGDSTTGVSVQTLHPTRFDEGAIVAQTPELSIAALLARGTCSSFDPGVPPAVCALVDQLGLRGADLLARVVADRRYAGPPLAPPYAPSRAPKLPPAARRVDWSTDSAARALAKLAALGPLYAFVPAQPRRQPAPDLRRVLFHDLRPYAGPAFGPPGAFRYDPDSKLLLLQMADHPLVCSLLQFQGFKPELPDKFMSSYQKRCGRAKGFMFQ